MFKYKNSVSHECNASVTSLVYNETYLEYYYILDCKTLVINLKALCISNNYPITKPSIIKINANVSDSKGTIHCIIILNSPSTVVRYQSSSVQQIPQFATQIYNEIYLHIFNQLDWRCAPGLSIFIDDSTFR